MEQQRSRETDFHVAKLILTIMISKCISLWKNKLIKYFACKRTREFHCLHVIVFLFLMNNLIKKRKKNRERRTLCVHSHQYIEKILSGTHSYRNYIIDSITTRGLWDHVFFMQQQIIAIVFLAGARITVGVFLTWLAVLYSELHHILGVAS